MPVRRTVVGSGVISRRRFALVVAGVLVCAPDAVAKIARPARRVGLLMSTTPRAASHIVAAFVGALRELGHVEGDDVVFEYRWAEGKPERFADLAAELVRHKVDVIVASSRGPALAAKRATSTIPIVMVNVTDPVEAGLVATLARPGGNVTGLSEQLTPEIRAKQLQLLKEALPRAARVAVLHSPATTVGLTEYSTAARGLALQVRLVAVRGPEDLAGAFATMARDGIDALLVPSDTLLFTERQRVVLLAREHRLPGIYSLREYTEAGGLMSYSVRISEQFRHAAVYVDKILKGASPATLPVQSPTEYELVVNLQTARALGVTLAPSLLARADEVLQ